MDYCGKWKCESREGRRAGVGGGEVGQGGGGGGSLLSTYARRKI